MNSIVVLIINTTDRSPELSKGLAEAPYYLMQRVVSFVVLQVPTSEMCIYEYSCESDCKGINYSPAQKETMKELRDKRPVLKPYIDFIFIQILCVEGLS